MYLRRAFREDDSARLRAVIPRLTAKRRGELAALAAAADPARPGGT